MQAGYFEMPPPSWSAQEPGSVRDCLPQHSAARTSWLAPLFFGSAHPGKWSLNLYRTKGSEWGG